MIPKDPACGGNEDDRRLGLETLDGIRLIREAFPDVQIILVEELNPYDVLCNDWVVFTKATLPGSKSE